jgi:hypothetical protein
MDTVEQATENPMAALSVFDDAKSLFVGGLDYDVPVVAGMGDVE